MSKYLDADARLEMTGQDTHLRVDGDLIIATCTASIFSLTGGTPEVKGNLRETEKFSFASSGSFTVAFPGEGSHRVDIESAPHSGFANIDSRYGSYTLAGSPLEIFGRGAYSIFVGVVEGLIELSQIEEMSETTLLLLKEKVSPEALKALAAALKEYGKKQLRRVVEAVEQQNIWQAREMM